MSSRLTWQSATPERTEQYGRAFAQVLAPGELLRLHGELGAGKTTFCRGLGIGLGLSEPMNSPTYLLCKEYAWRDAVVLHLDGYFEVRLASLLGESLLERFDGRNLVLVEWAENVAEWLPDDGLDLRIAAAADSMGGEQAALRQFELTATGEQAQRALSSWEAILKKDDISSEPSPPGSR